MAVVQALVVVGQAADPALIAEFTDLPGKVAGTALDLAVDLGLANDAAGKYSTKGPLSRFADTPDVRQRAAVLRIVLDDYAPFRFSRTAGSYRVNRNRRREHAGLA